MVAFFLKKETENIIVFLTKPIEKEKSFLIKLIIFLNKKRNVLNTLKKKVNILSAKEETKLTKLIIILKLISLINFKEAIENLKAIWKGAKIPFEIERAIPLITGISASPTADVTPTAIVVPADHIILTNVPPLIFEKSNVIHVKNKLNILLKILKRPEKIELKNKIILIKTLLKTTSINSKKLKSPKVVRYFNKNQILEKHI